MAYAPPAARCPPPPPAPVAGFAGQAPVVIPEQNTEKYAQIEDNPIHRTSEDPVSTFSIDVDTGSYSNVRRMLVAGERPPKTRCAPKR
jgi:Ca-activated chloride channel family protein